MTHDLALSDIPLRRDSESRLVKHARDRSNSAKTEIRFGYNMLRNDLARSEILYLYCADIIPID